VIDITPGAFGLLESIIGWEVSSSPALSNHRHILFNLQGSILVRLIRKPSGKNRGYFRGDLKDRLEKCPEMNTINKVGLRLAIHWVQQALI